MRVIEAFSALAHSGRLAVFRWLVRAGPDGAAAGDIARAFNTPANTLSTQLAILSRAGLIRSHRTGRSIIYAADFARVAEVLGFIVEDCCGGSPEVCTPLMTIATRGACCAADAATTPPQ